MNDATSLTLPRRVSVLSWSPARLVEWGARHGAPWLVPLLLLALWQLGASLGAIPPNVAPSPVDVAKAFGRLTASGELLSNIEISFLRALGGLLVGGSLGFALGLANGLSPGSERLLDSTVQMIRTVPHLALIPLVILWFGIEEDAKLFLVGLGVLFPVYINTFHGIRTVDAQLVEMARSYDMSGFELFRRVIFPGALPSIFVGLRYAIGIAWLTLIVAETIAAQSGIGYMAMNARDFMQVDVIVVAIIVYALLGKAADSLVRRLERSYLGWHAAFRDRN
ncbi:ABC transporter permease subunit [Telmatospirillum siberiense]|uniref:ABC transporter permease n=1 Tax=Telmatospirillum siberiense TaxID=382514 RepID=A0A2N3PP51_9PROT|nr:ABC transporter permease subunit [Telmatospirillum siberiense]PKU22167.1 ABC transporter permease [Telmatospirillum siberiense]